MRDTSFPSPPSSEKFTQLPPQHQQQQPQQQQQWQAQYSYAPPQWYPFTFYPPGAVVWSRGTYWRCEGPHTSGDETSGVPSSNLNLWTPVGSSQGQATGFGPAQASHQTQGYYQQPPSYQYQQYPISPPAALYSQNPSPYPNYGQGSAQNYHNYTTPSSASSSLYAPIPVRADAPSTSSMSEKNDTPSSGETITSPAGIAGRGHQSSGGSSSMEFFTSKAAESLRYLTLREETYKAKDKDELTHELKGKRIWRTGGIGIFAYSLDQSEEEAKKQVWRNFWQKHGRDEWEEAARQRTEFYTEDSHGVKPLFTWKLVEKGQRPPEDALPIGHESDGAVLFAARAWYEGGVHLGKAGLHLVNGANISYGGSEQTVETYEVFCGPIHEPYLVKWMTFRHGEMAHVEGWQPVEGGREKDGPALLLAKGEYENGEHPGKCLINDDHACVGYGGGELWVRPYQILAYANADRR